MAQLGARLDGIEEVVGSNPIGSTNIFRYLRTCLGITPRNCVLLCVVTPLKNDVLNRLTEKQYNDGSTSTVYFNYDGNTQTNCAAGVTDSNPKGQRTGMCDGAGSEAWSHDTMGRTLTDQRTANSVTKSFVYTYNLAGEVTKLAYPSGLSVTYAYDGAGRFATAKDNNRNTYAAGSCGTSGVCYTAAGAIQTATMDATANFAGFTVTDSYNPRLQPNELKVSNGSSSAMDFSYCFYPLASGACPASGTTDNGNVVAIFNNMDSTRSQTFSYDRLNRVGTGTSVANSGTNCWGEQYGYDAWGNLLTITLPSAYSACTQPDNLSVSVTTANQISGYTFDAAGNLDTIPGTGGGTYTYNAENQMTSTAGVTYTYDGDGKRVKKSNGTIYWYGMSSDPLSETNLSGTLINDYVFFGGQRIARRDPSGDTFAYFADHLGTSRKVEEIASGATTAILSYDADFYPFGRENAFTNNSGPIYKFTGKIRDAESGLDDFGARYNSSNLGRFMSSDPLGGHQIDPQTLNKYAYVRNNPLNLTDPTGLDLYLQGCGKDTSTCNGNFVGTTDGNGIFTRTQIQSDDSGNFNGHNVNFDSSGIHIDGKYQGVYAPETDATRVNGDADSGFAGTHFVVNSNCLGTCLAGGALYSDNGDTSVFKGVIATLEGPNKGLDSLGDHPGDQYRGGNKNGPDAHLSFVTDQNGNPTNGMPFHIDKRNPFHSVGGLLEHTGDLIASKIEEKMHLQGPPLPPDIRPKGNQ